MGEPVVLKDLLRQKHWQTYRTFCREYDQAAKRVDPALVGTYPSRAQLHRWLSGDLKGLPYPHHCQVLEAMFPSVKASEMFEPTPALQTPGVTAATGGVAQPLASGDAQGYSRPDPLQEARISRLWPRTNPEVLEDLLDRVSNATEEISVFGLTRNFYGKDDMLPRFEEKAALIPVTFYVMEPQCDSRKDRYRLEPVEAAMEDPRRYTREILRPLLAAARRVEPAKPTAGLRVFTFNFPCSFAIEKIDRSCRVMLYGHGKRGTESPMFVFDEGTPYYDYFDEQLQWLSRLARDPREPWTSKRLVVRPLEEVELAI